MGACHSPLLIEFQMARPAGQLLSPLGLLPETPVVGGPLSQASWGAVGGGLGESGMQVGSCCCG